jgi:hypothetical protein
VLVSGSKLAFLVGLTVLAGLAMVVGYRERAQLAIATRGYRAQLLARPRLVAIAIALAAFVLLAPLTGDPTWDAIDATFMSVGCYLTAPWACAIAYRAARGRASALEVVLAAIAWCFVTSWSYDLYLVVRDGVFPVTSRVNFFASTILYVLGGLFFSLGQHRDRGLFFVFMDDRWPTWHGDRWTRRGATTGLVLATLLAAPIIVFMVWVVMDQLGLLR